MPMRVQVDLIKTAYNAEFNVLLQDKVMPRGPNMQFQCSRKGLEALQAAIHDALNSKVEGAKIVKVETDKTGKEYKV